MSRDIDSTANGMYAVVRQHIANSAITQRRSIPVADASSQKLLALLEPLEAPARLLACERLMQHVGEVVKNLGGVGGFNREFMRLLTVCDPDLAAQLIMKMRVAHSADAIPETPFNVGSVTESIRKVLVIPYLTRWHMGVKQDDVEAQEEIVRLGAHTMRQIRIVLARYTPEQQKAVKAALLRRFQRDPETQASLPAVLMLLSDEDPEHLHVTMG